MDTRHERGSKRRHLAAVGLITATALIAAPGIAHAEPSASDVRKKVEKLEREFSELAEEYNAAKEDHDAAKKKLKDIDAKLDDRQDDLKDLRKQVGSMASAAYTGIDYSSPSYLFGSNGPEDALQQSADLGYLSKSQKSQLERYGDEAEKLKKLERQAKDTEEKAKDRLDDAKKAKRSGEKKVEKQQDILDDLTAEEQGDATSGVGGGSGSGGGSSSGGGGGGSYSGPATGNAKVALDFAYAQIGKPYIWGGTGPSGYDCSGLTQAAWKKAGVSLPRTSQAQFGAGNRISYSALQPGDLMFFYSSSPTHVGLYAGNGKMVHASTSSKPIMEVSLSSYYEQNFVGGVRP